MDDIVENFRLLAAEAENQVALTLDLVADFSSERLERITNKDDYIDNLKTSIENACFSAIHAASASPDKRWINRIRAVHIMCVNLERVADFCLNIGRQVQYLSKPNVMEAYDYGAMFSESLRALGLVFHAFEKEDLGSALAICRAEFTLDDLFKEGFAGLMNDLKKGKLATDVVTIIFIFRYLERIGDAILNVGEALVFAITGDRIKIRQVDALEKTLNNSGFQGALSEVDFSSIWGSRSGCRISRVGRKSAGREEGIFKEGDIRKIKQEMDNMKRWGTIWPGLVPAVLGYHERSKTAAMIVEFLSGHTLDQIILTEPAERVQAVMDLLIGTLEFLWRKTMQRTAVPTDYMGQLEERVASVLRVHPGFQRPAQRIGSLCIPDTLALFSRCREIEADLRAPFSVFIHGDFNTNNILYQAEAGRIRYIDLYRSREADYVQDASVFIVSNFRLPVFKRSLRHRLNQVTRHFVRFLRRFAGDQGDTTFEVRMALALARSFFTSTRFELNTDFAQDMFLNSHYLMERVAAHRGRPWEQFLIPEECLLF